MALSLPLSKSTSSRAKKAHCEVDDWDFDPRLTDGVCPICGWRPELAAVAQPHWIASVERVPWDLVLLFVVFVGLTVMGVIVGLAAHINILPK